VKKWYSSKIDIQRHQQQNRKYNDYRIASTNPNSWQADLAFWGKTILLTAVNINSRIGYSSLLADKRAATVLTAIKSFVKEHTVNVLTTDNGSEFMNRTVQAYLKSNDISHYNNEAGDHGTMGKIERFNRTLKARLIKIDKPLTNKLLSDVIFNYNNTKHRSINMTPNQAKGRVIESDLEHNEENLNKTESELEIGSSVLYRLKKKQFGKESVRWSKAVYSIVGIDGYRVQI
jgi:formylmethanofuran dehydrogenase subunit E-like metal-binding protein